MRIGIFANEFDGRGCGRVCNDYGLMLSRAGHEVFYIASSDLRNAALRQASAHGEILLYSGKPDNDVVNFLIDKGKLDFMHMIKYGVNDGICPTACPVGVQCVFRMDEPHGTIYAGVSEYLAKKFEKTEFVPHIVRKKSPTEDWRRKLKIPHDALVFGRHGGPDQFDLSFVHEAIKQALEKRDDLWFIFLSTNKFMPDHPRVIHLDWLESDQDVTNFIYACDIMIHARRMGETFGLACAEFSAANKPVWTWDGGEGLFHLLSYDQAHIQHLRPDIDAIGAAFLYNQKLLDFLCEMNRPSRDAVFDVVTDRFSEANVLKKYEEVFLSKVSPKKKDEPEPIVINSDKKDWNRVFEEHGTDKGSYHKFGAIYKFLFERYVDRECKLMEIGVYEGSSLRAWTELLPKAKIVGIDKTDTHEFDRSRITIETGNATDEAFLEGVNRKHGPFDIVIDDGSHVSGDQQSSFCAMYQRLKPGGVYVIEDLEVSYKSDFQAEHFVPTLDFFKSAATRNALTVGAKCPFFIFAGELLAIIKPE